ncbi:unnamed protein product [Soboliphyme baturini]|uniref:Uncharacterized protein n=1 Tax=Soboliphyme baturini TaxID=241478 RepID=A0A183IMV1_9BILA|nr:unnamed protein product [Soboliphyme baturini]
MNRQLCWTSSSRRRLSPVCCLTGESLCQANANKSSTLVDKPLEHNMVSELRTGWTSSCRPGSMLLTFDPICRQADHVAGRVPADQARMLFPLSYHEGQVAKFYEDFASVSNPPPFSTGLGTGNGGIGVSARDQQAFFKVDVVGFRNPLCVEESATSVSELNGFSINLYASSPHKNASFLL